MIYKNTKNGDIVEDIVIANTATDSKNPIIVVFKKIETNEVYTELAQDFFDTYRLLNDFDVDTQLRGIDFIA